VLAGRIGDGAAGAPADGEGPAVDGEGAVAAANDSSDGAAATAGGENAAEPASGAGEAAAGGEGDGPADGKPATSADAGASTPVS
jgi:hypothetical protein